ncbi:MAG: 16S rRNA (adenine(1518)-N(6)/adenine(1519)-N(6))-dimethyltransferase RsmA [Patescibacteria group bacterium UBA2163]
MFRKKTPKLGQHLLTSRAIAQAVVNAGEVGKGDTVVEIGPGKGMLTRELIATGAQVIAIEKDPEMIAVLSDFFSNEISDGTLSVYQGDARDMLTETPFPFKAPYKIIANIPYYITGELLRLFLTAPVQPTDISLLVQKEVAERIARAQKESLLSLSVKAFGEPQYVRTVKAGSFNPPPNVDSAILAVHGISRDIFSKNKEKLFFELLHAGFGQKRKTLLGNLKRSGITEHATLEDIWAQLNLDVNVRAEDVPLTTWIAIAEIIKND